jgi:hypothetical protein
LAAFSPAMHQPNTCRQIIMQTVLAVGRETEPRRINERRMLAGGRIVAVRRQARRRTEKRTTYTSRFRMLFGSPLPPSCPPVRRIDDR